MTALTPRIRIAEASILLMAPLAFCTMSVYWTVVRSSTPARDRIEMNERRFTGVRMVLAPTKTIGYLSDADLHPEKAYYLTQYYLAPVIVAPDTAHDVVLGNFSSAAALVRGTESAGFTVERDFGNGVALLRKRSR